ncbi:MAG: hypothetical protein M3380_02205 [Chloroflexota bacterium]|nr:hypothetical protein [Chloroflexota bacterium]
MNILTAVTAAAGGVVGLLVWRYLLHQGKGVVPAERLLTTALVVGLICRIASAILTPTFQAPDEQSHFNYVKYLDVHQSFPVQVSKTNASSNDWEYYQPPLYYVLCLPVYWITSRLGGDGDYIIVRSIRSVSIMLWAINLHFTRKLLQNLLINDIFVRAFVICMITLLPTYVFLSSSINNDNLLIALGGLLLYIFSKDITNARSILSGILLGVALLTKLTAVVYIFALIAVLATYYAVGKMSLTVALLRFSTASFIATAIWIPWGLRNIRVYGDITGEQVANIPYHWESSYDAVLSIISYISRSFSSVSGIHNNVIFFPVVGFFLIGMSFIGMFHQARSWQYFFRLHPIQYRSSSYMLGMALAVIINFVLIVRFGFLYNQGQGRFLYPMLAPISVFIAVGIKLMMGSKCPQNAHIHAIGFFVTYLLSFTGFSLAVFYTIDPQVLLQRDIRFP